MTKGSPEHKSTKRTIYILLFTESNNYVTYVNCPKCDSNKIIKRSNL